MSSINRQALADDLLYEDTPTLPGTGSSAAQFSVEQGSYRDPDDYNKSVELSKRSKMSLELVDHDRPEVERQQLLRDLSLESMEPGLSDWLEKPENAGRSYDDVPILNRLAKRDKPWYDINLKGMGDNIVIGLGKLTDQIMLQQLSAGPEEGVTSTLDMMKEEKRKRGLPVEEGTLLDMDEGERQTRINMYKASLETADQAISENTPQDLTTLGEGVRGAVQMVADMAPGLAISAATRGKVNPTLPYLTAKTGLESYGSARVAEKSHEQAMLYGVTDATLEFLTEKLPTKWAEKMIGDIGTGSVKESLAKFMIGDMAGEQVATFTQSMNALGHGLDEELASADLGEAINIQAHRQVVTAISTLLGSGSISGGAWAADRMLNKNVRQNRKVMQHIEKRMQSAASQEWLDDQISLAQSSKLNERSSEAFNEYLESLDPESHVFINPDAFKDLDLDLPDYVTEQLDGTGAHVSVKLSNFLSDFAKDENMMGVVRDHVRVEENLMSKKEVADNAGAEEIEIMINRSRETKEAMTEAQMVFNQVKEQLIGTGRQGQSTSRLSAEVIPAYVVAKQADLKKRGYDVTVQEIFDDMKLKIAGPGDQVVPEQGADVLNEEFGQLANSLDLVVGGRTQDGKVFAGEKGDLHFSLQDRHPEYFDYRRPSEEDPEMGFIDKNGKFYSRAEAFELVRQQYPDVRDPIGTDELESEALEEVRGVYSQQKFGDLEITREMVDEAGNKVIVTEKAQTLWNNEQKRLKMVEKLRECISA